jgi:hypothetical protein
VALPERGAPRGRTGVARSTRSATVCPLDD